MRKPKFGSLFSGIGGFDRSGMKRPNCDELLCGHDAKVGKPMAIWAKDNAIFNGVLSALAARRDVVSVATCLIPATTHTAVLEQTPQSRIPTALIGIDLLAFMNIGLAFIPGNDGTLTHTDAPGGYLGGGSFHKTTPLLIDIVSVHLFDYKARYADMQ